MSRVSMCESGCSTQFTVQPDDICSAKSHHCSLGFRLRPFSLLQLRLQTHGSDGCFFFLLPSFSCKKQQPELRGSLTDAAEASFCICGPHDVAKSKKKKKKGQSKILKSPSSGHLFKYRQREPHR